MSLVALGGISAVVTAILLLAWSVQGHRPPGRRGIQENLSRGLMAGKKQPKQKREQRFDALASRFTPSRLISGLDRRLALAGRPAGWPLKRLVSAKIVLAVLGGILGVLYFHRAPDGKSALLALFVTVVAYFLPDLLIHSKGMERQKAIMLELPDTLDQMTIAVEAGLGFDAAMARTGQNGRGPLAAEFVRTLQDMQLGMSRREAYATMLERTSAPDLRRFVNAVIQADRYGISISGVLRTQATEMRLKRRQRAEEKAMQIPVKVLFPLMVCIMPVLFIALLGPAAINVMETLAK
jgi:tight adherence protein C